MELIRKDKGNFFHSARKIPPSGERPQYQFWSYFSGDRLFKNLCLFYLSIPVTKRHSSFSGGLFERGGGRNASEYSGVIKGNCAESLRIQPLKGYGNIYFYYFIVNNF